MGRSAASATILLFGATSLLTGAAFLLSPRRALASLQLPDEAAAAADAMSLAAVAMGLYYALAARQDNRLFFLLTVPMRSLTALVFWSHGGPWRTAAAWEAGGALLTAAAVLWDFAFCRPAGFAGEVIQ